ncbi:putative type-2 restriction enzyme NmeDIP [uncultured Spirochaetota bacterium]|uniref:Putative type-2 restriction enzyme NmeDIP n=1 Tax=uncultured Spirochaetota bacterium TaxID=460511 RepID=A0A652ZVU9_9SPIR|nr:putative type-2 restriction enzyme NmeDIP [uncultured Spirochaetota bacterium]
MTRITASNLAYWISQLDHNVNYNYINPKNKGLIRIVQVQLPEGPIFIKRWNPSQNQTIKDAENTSISTNLLWRVANAITEDTPINIDRIVGASYNTRAVLETLLAYTPLFHITHPGRIENINSTTEIKKGHKHIVWLPDSAHKSGILNTISSDRVISEIPSQQAVYESLVFPDNFSSQKDILNIEQSRRHAQIQIALVLIGMQLGFRTWVAQNDRGIEYNHKKLGEWESVVPSLKDENLLLAFPDAANAALLIDCIWFKNGKFMPAVMEVEYTTGITSGLSRMKNFKDRIPAYPTRYVIVAPDEERSKFLREAEKPQFKDLKPMFFPFSGVEELYSLCQRRKITRNAVNETFLDCFMEKTA